MQIHCGISKARAWLRTQGYGRNGKQTRNEGEKRRFAWDHRLVSSYLSDKLNILITSIVLVCLVSFFNGEEEARQTVKGSPPLLSPISLFTSAAQATSCLEMWLNEKRTGKSALVWANPESIDGVSHKHVKNKMKKSRYDFATCVGNS